MVVSVLPHDVEQWLAREVAVGAFVAERSDLVVPPSYILPPGPHEQDGLWMTLWKFVPHDAEAAPPKPGEFGRSLRRMHASSPTSRVIWHRSARYEIGSTAY